MTSPQSLASILFYSISVPVLFYCADSVSRKLLGCLAPLRRNCFDCTMSSIVRILLLSSVTPGVSEGMACYLDTVLSTSV